MNDLLPSLRSRLINALIRNRHLLHGRLRREVMTMDSSIAAFRAQCRRSAAALSRLPPGVEIERLSLAGIAAERIVPAAAPPDKLILYAHGGGYVSGSSAEHRGFVARLASELGFAALTYDYRLAPEHPYPAAVDDTLAVYRALLARFPAGNLLVAGESAGGGLALALLFALKRLGLPYPCAAVAISPWTDLSCSGAGYRTRNARSVAPRDSWTVFANHYAAGVDVLFRAGAGMIHCYPLLAPMFPEASVAMREIADFARRHLTP